LAGPGQSPGLTSLPGFPEAGNGHEVSSLCWARHKAHARRKFYDIHVATKAPLAEEALRRIAALYEIKTEIRGRTAEQRYAVRRALSRPLVEAMHTWLTETLGRISGRSALAQAIRYALNHWTGLVLFLKDGRLEMDTNTVERAMRPVALGRKTPCSPEPTAVANIGLWSQR
jgi:transposase